MPGTAESFCSPLPVSFESVLADGEGPSRDRGWLGHSTKDQEDVGGFEEERWGYAPLSTERRRAGERERPQPLSAMAVKYSEGLQTETPLACSTSLARLRIVLRSVVTKSSTLCIAACAMRQALVSSGSTL